jgi:diguanylate cyclase (GGDEF)-like protein
VDPTGDRLDRGGRVNVAAWLGVPASAVDHVSDEVVEAIQSRMTGQHLHASVLRDELLELLKGAAERYRREAETDPLTALPNRRAFERELRGALGRRDADRSLAVLIVDLDGFKEINDRFGHVAGDLVLCEVGARLRASIRSGDMVARWGGDEFVILCRDVRPDALEQIACKLARLVDVPVSIGGHEATVSASVGCATASAGHTPAALIAAADAAMYTVKGRTPTETPPSA